MRMNMSRLPSSQLLEEAAVAVVVVVFLHLCLHPRCRSRLAPVLGRRAWHLVFLGLNGLCGRFLLGLGLGFGFRRLRCDTGHILPALAVPQRLQRPILHGALHGLPYLHIALWPVDLAVLRLGIVSLGTFGFGVVGLGVQRRVRLHERVVDGVVDIDFDVVYPLRQAALLCLIFRRRQLFLETLEYTSCLLSIYLR
jgi:hypothetical protein